MIKHIRTGAFSVQKVSNYGGKWLKGNIIHSEDLKRLESDCTTYPYVRTIIRYFDIILFDGEMMVYGKSINQNWRKLIDLLFNGHVRKCKCKKNRLILDKTMNYCWNCGRNVK